MQTTRLGTALLLLTIGTGSAFGAGQPSAEQDMAGIEKLHQQDKEATLSDSADQLEKLWDKDAVRFIPGLPAEIGRAKIYSDDKGWEMTPGRERSMCYDMEVQDIQLAGDWAFEWGYGSYKTAKAGKVSIGYSKVMRVMKRQPDGSWRFARVMGLPAPSEAGVVLKHPCR